MSCKREDAPAIAFARTHAAHGDHDPGDGDLFAVAAAFDGGEVDGAQFRQASPHISTSGWPEM